jgi:hypothetical protein
MPARLENISLLDALSGAAQRQAIACPRNDPQSIASFSHSGTFCLKTAVETSKSRKGTL